MKNSIPMLSLRDDLSKLVAELLPLKAALRRPWTQPMADVQRRVHALAAEITARLISLAWSRGRRHLSSPPLWLRDAGLAHDLEGYQCRVAERIAGQYRLDVPLAIGAAP
jgi:hypothetical protein